MLILQYQRPPRTMPQLFCFATTSGQLAQRLASAMTQFACFEPELDLRAFETENSVIFYNISLH